MNDSKDLKLRNRLMNSKIWVGDNPKKIRKLQERLFELGFSWSGNVRKVKYEDELQYLVLYSDLTICYGRSKESYYDEEQKEVTI
jgi:hypothetical protein